MRVHSPITILAGENLEPFRRVRFAGTAWVYADAYEMHDAVTGPAYIANATYGQAYPANDVGLLDVETAGAIAAGAKLNGKDDGKCDDDGAGVVFGFNCGAAVGSGDRAPALHTIRGSNLVYKTLAASGNLSALSAETNFDQTIQLAANTLKAGDVIRFFAVVRITASNSTDTFVFRVKIGSTVLALSGTIDAANDDVCVITGQAIVRTDGASGTIVSGSLSFNGTGGAAAAAADIPTGSHTASTTLDTTAAQTLAVSAQHSTNNAGNVSRLEMFNVEIVR